jgi:hypothetical protein
MDCQGYADAVGDNLKTAGYSVSTTEVDGRRALFGYRSDLRLRWMGTKLHTFVVVGADGGELTAAGLEQFSHRALDHGVRIRGQLRGLQTGVGVIPIMVADRVMPPAASMAAGKLVRRWAAFAWPVAVDLESGQRFWHRGRVVVGGIYAGWMRGQIEVVLPDPSR